MTPPHLAIDNPAFVLQNKDVMGLEAEIQIGHRADKMGTSAVLTFRTNNISGYDMNVMVQGVHGSTWQKVEQVGAVSIEIVGDYEREILIAFLQKVGLLTVPVFGKYDRGPFEGGEE
jgi:hypothetical protein